jgi:SpoVK/Ycf46/Vps4 family AAA+-type ATPase
VLLAATSNNISALPPEMLRKGRFDEIFFVDLPSAEVRAALFALHLRKRGRDAVSFDVARLAAESEGFPAPKSSRQLRRDSIQRSARKHNSQTTFCLRKFTIHSR